MPARVTNSAQISYQLVCKVPPYEWVQHLGASPDFFPLVLWAVDEFRAPGPFLVGVFDVTLISLSLYMKLPC